MNGNRVTRETGSSVNTVSGYGLHDLATGFRFPAEAKGIFLDPLCPDRLWGPISLLYNGYRWVPSPGVKRSRGVTLTIHPHLVPRYRTIRSYISSPHKRLLGV
jgi:hypothetical protein